MSETFTLPDMQPFVAKIEAALDLYADRPDFLNKKVAEIWQLMELEAETPMESINLNNGRYIMKPKILDNPVRH